jgi:hypothetical protein
MIVNHLALSNARLPTFKSTKFVPRLRNRAPLDAATLKSNGIPIHGGPIPQIFTTVTNGVQGVPMMAAYPTRSMHVITTKYPISIRNDEIPVIHVWTT